jgi:type I restriction enzyme R subunit
MFELFKMNYPEHTGALILHDEGTKLERRDEINLFKTGKTDFLFVFNMLLTGFDAPRLKKLYLGRVLRAHNLLQGLTRVNRTYRHHRYGYVVDFADISKEFDKTNKDYWDELQGELGDEIDKYSNLFISKEEIDAEINQIKDVLWQYDTSNGEVFSQQISQISDIAQLQLLVKVLDNARSLYNTIRVTGNHELLAKIDFDRLLVLSREARNCLERLNLKNKMDEGADMRGLLNEALEDIIFQFVKIGESELKLADDLKNSLRKTREELSNNFDPKDPEYTTLKDELERLFKQKKLSEVTQEEMKQNIGYLNEIYAKIRELNRKNNLLRDKYNGDSKFVRVHKRLLERGGLTQTERNLHSALFSVKSDVDEKVWQNTQMLDNEEFFNKLMMSNVISSFTSEHIPLNPEITRYINGLVVREYINEFNGVTPW